MKKTIAILLAILSLAMLFTGCAQEGSAEIVLPVQDVADTPENRQKAMVEIAKAYFNKNPYVQYACENLTPVGRSLCATTSSDMGNTPEMAGPQRTIYHVCSFYTYICTYHTFDYRILGSWAASYIAPVATKSDKEIAPYVIFSHTNSPKPEENMEKMEEFRSLLQPGDLVYYTRYKKSGSTHALIWVGDVDGDGDSDVLGSNGKGYDKENMIEFREPEGGIEKNADYARYVSGDYFFFDPAAYDYYPLLKDVGIVRFSDKADVLPLTERAKTRVLFPDMTIFFDVEGGIYGSAVKGDEVTYTMTIRNGSTQEYQDLLVQFPVPENAEIVKVMGKPSKNRTVKLQVDIPAGGSVNLDYTVKATGNVGDVIRSGVGYVHAIPLPSLNTTIIAEKTDAAKAKAAMDATKTGEAFLDAYLKNMGYNVTIPTVADLQKELYDRKSFGEYKILALKDEADYSETAKALAKMQIPDFFGGQYVATSADSLRVKELRNQDLQAGDVLIWKVNSPDDPIVAIHDGNALLMPVNGQLVAMEQEDLDRFIMYNYFIALRPSAGI